MRHRAGESVEVQVTWLEMTARPSYPHPHLPGGAVSALVAAEAPPSWYFLALYDAVGSDYDWTDQHQRSDTELAAWLADPERDALDISAVRLAARLLHPRLHH